MTEFYTFHELNVLDQSKYNNGIYLHSDNYGYVDNAFPNYDKYSYEPIDLRRILGLQKVSFLVEETDACFTSIFGILSVEKFPENYLINTKHKEFVHDLCDYLLNLGYNCEIIGVNKFVSVKRKKKVIPKTKERSKHS